MLQATENPDVHTGVIYDAAGKRCGHACSQMGTMYLRAKTTDDLFMVMIGLSQAALEIQLIRGKHLPRRCNRLRDCVRAFIHS